MADELEKKLVRTALINNADQILVVKRSQHTRNPGKLGLPGGMFREDECVEDAARREVFNEIGVDIDFKTRSFIKFHPDTTRTILIARMPSPSSYVFDLNPQEVGCIFWMKTHEIAQHLDPNHRGDKLHKSLEVTIPLLMDLEPRLIVNAFINPFGRPGDSED